MFRTISNFMRVAEIRSKIIIHFSDVSRIQDWHVYPSAIYKWRRTESTRSIKCLRYPKYIWRWRLEELLHLRDGNHAVYYSIHHRAIIADGCCS